jgi:hypothetical protein
MWPRAAALAELFWTGAGETGYPRSERATLILCTAHTVGTIEAYPRMHDARYRMVDRGVRAQPLQPHWCALRPGMRHVLGPESADCQVCASMTLGLWLDRASEAYTIYMENHRSSTVKVVKSVYLNMYFRS